MATRTSERDEGSAIDLYQNPRIERNDQVVSALNRIIDVLERLSRVLIDPEATYSFVDSNFINSIDGKCDFLLF